MANASTKTVVVVGSGVAGLTTAYRLQQKGFDVTVVEEQDRPGGRMANEMRGTFNAFTGATGLYAFYVEMWALFEELGLMDKLHQYPTFGSGLMNRRDGSYLFDSNRTVSMLWHKGLSLRSRLRLPLLLPDFLRTRGKVNPNLLHTAAEFDTESMSDYLIRKVGRDFYENIVCPVYRSLWSWNPDDTSRAYFMSIYSHVRGKPCYRLRMGLGTFTKALAEKLSIQYNTKVLEIARAGEDNRRVLHCMTAEGEETIRADIVVNAVEGWYAGELVNDRTPYEEVFFKPGVPYAQYYMATFPLKSACNEFPTRSYFARDNQNPITFMHTYGGSDEPGDVARVWALLGTDRARHYVGPNGEGLADVLKRYISEKVSGFQDQIKEEHTMFDRYYIAAFPTGQLKRVNQFLTSQEAGPKNIYYVGEYLSNATTGGACAIGDRTARIISDHWGAAH